MSKEDIFHLSSQGFSYAEIGKKLNISRQRAHQVIKNYRHSGRKGRQKLYDKAWSETCEKCKKLPSVALHHKNGNNEDDDISNLISLCTSCHYLVHTQTHISLVVPCEKCKAPLRYKNISRIESQLCWRCKKEEKTGKRVVSREEKNRLRPKECIICKRPFQNKVKFSCKGKCERCYGKPYQQSKEAVEWRKRWYLKRKALGLYNKPI